MSVFDRVTMRDVLAIAGVSVDRKGYARCPFHSEDSASFHVIGEQGRETGYKCFGCNAHGGVGDFLVAMKLARDLADAARLLEEKFALAPRVTASFTYTSDGKPVARIDRKEPGRNGKAKDFLPYIAQGNGFSDKPGLDGAKLPLYHREEVLDAARRASTIVMVEGEGKGDALRAKFLENGTPIAVTTVNGGANATMLDSHVADFAGASRVYVIADSDKPGRECANRRASLIANAHPTCKVYTVDLYPDRSDGSDVGDFVASGRGLDELRQIFARATQVAPQAAPGPKDGVLSFTQLMQRGTEQIDWFIEGLLRQSGMMLLASKPKVGKSTMARNIAYSVASGTDFLGRRCKQGKVLWIGLEEPLSHLLDQIEIMQMQDLPIAWVVDRPAVDENEWLDDVIAAHEPKLVIIDTIGRFSNVEDINHYSQVTRATQPMLSMRSKYGCAFVLLHHNNHADKTLGSVMWEGVVDTVLSLTRNPDGQRYLKTIQRSGTEMPETTLSMDEVTLRMSAPEPKFMTDQRAAEQRILQILGDGELRTREYLAQHCGRKVYDGRAAVDSLVSAGLIIAEGRGVKNSAKLYRLAVHANGSRNTSGQSIATTNIYVEESVFPEESPDSPPRGIPEETPENPEHPEDSVYPDVSEETVEDKLRGVFRSPSTPSRIVGSRMCSVCRRIGVCTERDGAAVCGACIKVAS